MSNPIKHVIYLLLENQSFDRMLGCMKRLYPNMEGLNGSGTSPYSNSDGTRSYQQQPTTSKQVTPDPKHELRFVLEQIAGNNTGFVKDFVEQYPNSTPEQRQEIMGYYDLGFLPAMHTLAQHFTICDHWFSSLPGPTWPNRFFALTGTCRGQALMPEGWRDPQLAAYFDQTQDTIFDRLNEAHRSWRVYFYDFPASLLLAHQRYPQNLVHYRLIDNFFNDCANESEFPDFVFIEPKYFGVDQNDDHPPHNIYKGEKLIADVYNAIRSSPDLWNSSLLVVSFDEHGGFYDHVSPPTAISPDQYKSKVYPDKDEPTFSFDRLGVRVPVLLISPWVAKGVESTQYDHTSLLKYMTELWGLGSLGNRTAAANTISKVITDRRRNDTPGFVRVSYTDLIPPDPALEHQDSSRHHEALHAFAYFLAKQANQPELFRLLAKGPSVAARAKEALGRLLLSMGSGLVRDLDQFKKTRVDTTMRLIQDMIRQTKAQPDSKNKLSS